MINVQGFIAQENAEEAQEEAEKNFVPWCWEGVEIFDNIGRERVLAPEVLFDPQVLEMDEWVCVVLSRNL